LIAGQWWRWLVGLGFARLVAGHVMQDETPTSFCMIVSDFDVLECRVAITISSISAASHSLEQYLLYPPLSVYILLPSITTPDSDIIDHTCQANIHGWTLQYRKTLSSPSFQASHHAPRSYRSCVEALRKTIQFTAVKSAPSKT